MAMDHGEETLRFAELHFKRQQIGQGRAKMHGMGVADGAGWIMRRDLNARSLGLSSDAPNFLMPAGIFDVWHQHIITARFDDAAISAKAREGFGPSEPHTAIIRHAA